jgi:hypothetical protein
MPATADHLFKKDIKQISISNYIAPSNNMSPGQVRSDSSHVWSNLCLVTGSFVSCTIAAHKLSLLSGLLSE